MSCGGFPGTFFIACTRFPAGDGAAEQDFSGFFQHQFLAGQINAYGRGSHDREEGVKEELLLLFHPGDDGLNGGGQLLRYFVVGCLSAADGIGDAAVACVAGDQPDFIRIFGEIGKQGGQVALRHGIDICGVFHQFIRNRTAFMAGEVDAMFPEEDVKRFRAGLLTGPCGSSCGTGLPFRMARGKFPEQAFRHGAAAGVAGADEEDMLTLCHESGRSLLE